MRDLAHTLAEDLELAHYAAHLATASALRYFGAATRSWLKPDASPVTEADLALDRLLVEVFREKRPQDAILSEESGAHGNGPRRWIIDPLDGTSAFMAGQGGWGILIALEALGEPVLGVIAHPADGMRYWAVRGEGARAARQRDGQLLDVRPLMVSTVNSLAAARVTAWPASSTPAMQSLMGVGRWVEPDFYFLTRLIEGDSDVLLSQGGEIWDHAAAVVIVEEAGGRFRDPAGGRRLDLHGGLYTNGLLDEAVLKVLGWPR